MVSSNPLLAKLNNLKFAYEDYYSGKISQISSICQDTEKTSGKIMHIKNKQNKLYEDALRRQNNSQILSKHVFFFSCFEYHLDSRKS